MPSRDVTITAGPPQAVRRKPLGLAHDGCVGAAVAASSRVAGVAVEVIVVATVVVQLPVLFGDVVARALAKTYFVGTSDLSAVNMSIIAFGGAILADRRQQHVRMSTVLDSLPPAPRSLVMATRPSAAH